jgi:hypothetical protein
MRALVLAQTGTDLLANEPGPCGALAAAISIAARPTTPG